VDDFRNIHRASFYDSRNITELIRREAQRTKQSFNIHLAALWIKKGNEVYAGRSSSTGDFNPWEYNQIGLLSGRFHQINPGTAIVIRNGESREAFPFGFSDNGFGRHTLIAEAT
jgi:hypothetical protein